MAKLALAIGVILTFVALYVILLSIAAVILMVAWNLSLPFVFGLPAVGFWHSFGLVLVASILIKGVSVVAKK